MSYQIKPLAGDRYIDGMLQGSFWNADVLSFSLSDGWSGEIWNAPDYMSNQFVTATAQMIRFTGLEGQWAGTFSDPFTAYDAGSDINLTLDSANVMFSGNTAWARGFFPNTSPEALAGDITINTRSAANSLPSYASGSQGFFLLLHELGHALGLKHPHDDGGANRPTFTELEIEEWDFDLFTVMSYNDTNFDLVQYNPATPMILDVLALQHLYGVNTIDYAGNTQWSLVETAHYETVFDPGGTNILKLSDASAGWQVQIPEDTIGASTTPVGWAHIDSNSGLPETFYWLAGSYSQVDGSTQADRLTGSDRNDVINGGSGSDIMRGGLGHDLFDQNPELRAGADQMTGGPGDDRYYVDSVNDVILELANGGVDRVHLVGPTVYSLPNHIEALISESNRPVSLIGNVADNQFDVVRASGHIDGVGGQNHLIVDQSAGETHLDVSADQVTLTHRTQGHQLTLTAIDTIAFREQNLQLDALQQLAQTPAQPVEEITRLYIIYFDRAPDASGLRHWVNQYNQELSLDSIATSFFHQPEALYLKELTNERLIETAYQNILQRKPDVSGASYWENELEIGNLSRPDLLPALAHAALADSSTDEIRLNEKVDLAMFFAWERGISDIGEASSLFDAYQSEGFVATQAQIERIYGETFVNELNIPLITYSGRSPESVLNDELFV